MFGILGSLTRAAVGVVTAPVKVVADVVTLGGSLTDRKDSYTEEAIEDIFKNLLDATKPR